MIRSVKKLSDSRCPQKSSETSAVNPLATADVKNKKVLKDIAESGEEEVEQILHICFDDGLSLKLPAGYTETAMAIDEVRCCWVRSCRQPAFLFELGTDDTFKNVFPLLLTFFIQSLYHSSLF